MAELPIPRELSIHAAALKPRGGVGVAAGLWSPWPRRGDLAHLFAVALAREGAPERIAWKQVKRRTLPWFTRLVDDLWAARWLSLRVVVGLGDEVFDARDALALTALFDRLSSVVDGAAERRIRVASGEDASMAQQVAKLFGALLQSAYRGRPATPAQLALVHHVTRLSGVEDLTVLAGSASAHLAVWRPSEVVRRQRGRAPLPSTSVVSSGR